MPRKGRQESAGTPESPPPLPECYPEMLPEEDLRSSLNDHGVPFAPDASHGDLSRLYRECLCPKAQRTSFRSNRRGHAAGQAFQLRQIREEKGAKRKAELVAQEGGSASKSSRIFAPAQSVHNGAIAMNQGSVSALNADPVNGRLKPAPGMGSKSSTPASIDSKTTLKLTQSLDHIIINDGPRKKREREVEEMKGIETAATPGCSGSGRAEGVEGGAVSTGKKQQLTVPAREGPFWDMFGSISSASFSATASSSFPSSSPSTSPKPKLSRLNGDSPKSKSTNESLITTSKPKTHRVLKLNRNTVLPQQVSELMQQTQQPAQQQLQPLPISSQPVPSFISSSTPAFQTHPLKSASPAPSSCSPMNGSPRVSTAHHGSLSDSGSDMDVSEATPVKAKPEIKKISWP